MIARLQAIIATVTATDTATLFDRLSPLMSNASFRTLQIHPQNWTKGEIHSLIIKLFEGKMVPQLYFKLNDSEESRFAA